MSKMQIATPIILGLIFSQFFKISPGAHDLITFLFLGTNMYRIYKLEEKCKK